MKTKSYVAFVVSVGLSASLAAAAPAMAQAAQPSYRAAQERAQTTHFSDAQIQKYVTAQARVQRIAEKWQQKIQQAKNRQTARQYRREASQAMIRAIEDAGLSLSEYNQITRAARTNKALARRIKNAR